MTAPAPMPFDRSTQERRAKRAERKAALKDLLDVVSEVDARILQVFTDAYADVEREFTAVISERIRGEELVSSPG